MKKIIGFILALSLFLTMGLTNAGCAVSSGNDPTYTPSPPADTQVPYQSITEDFIKNDATYRFDGIEGSLIFKNITGSTQGNATTPVQDWEFTVEYQTRHPGHGDRTGQVLAQKITIHTAVIKIDDGQIVSAICDTFWDMLNDKDVAPVTSGAENARKIAEDFVKHSSTFKFDGIEDSLKLIRTDPGWASSFLSTAYTFEYQTRHPGHGDRTGQVLAQVISDHTAVILVNTEKGTVALAICDKSWDMVNEKNPPASVIGIVISGGDTSQPGGPMDVPRTFVYKVQRADGSFVNVSYIAYPPSPVGDAARAKITLDFSGGSINIGDTMEALGRLDKETNTIEVADQGDYIKTYLAKP